MATGLNANHIVYMLMATRWTIALSAIAFVGGGMLGVLLVLARMQRVSRLLRIATGLVIRTFLVTPLVMQLFLFYFGLGSIGFTFGPWTSASVALICYTGVLLGETWRGCLESIPRGQWDAGRALAMSDLKILRSIIVPQSARIAAGPTVGVLVQVIKSTSFTSIIGFVELIRAGQIVNTMTFQPIAVYGIIMAIYFVLCWPLSLLAGYCERRLYAKDRRVEQPSQLLTAPLLPASVWPPTTTKGRHTMQRLKAVLAASLMLAILAGWSRVHAQTLDEISKRGTLMVGITSANAPFSSLNASMEMDGYDVAVAKALARALGVSLQIVDTNVQNRIPFLLTKKVDVILSTLVITPARARQVMFSIPYATNTFQIIAAKDRKIESPSDLGGLKVGAIRSGPAEARLRAVAPKDVTVVGLDDVAAVVQALVSGQVDAVAEGWLVVAEINKAVGKESYAGKFDIGGADFGVAMRPGSFELLQFVNTFIYTEKRSGELASFYETYLHRPFPELPVF